MQHAPCFEEHGEVLAQFVARGYSRETLVCLDRHLDVKLIPDAQLARIRACMLDAQAVAALHRDVPFRGDDRHAYGLDNFYFAAGALGLVSRLVWVLPGAHSNEALFDLLWDRLSLVPHASRAARATFRLTEFGAEVSLGVIEIAVTTLERLPLLELDEAELDIDLDGLCDDQGRVLASPEQVAAQLRAAGLADRAPTLTYSISSGFTPPDLRPLGEQLLSALGARAEPASSARPRYRAMEALMSSAALDAGTCEALWKAELEPLGGMGLHLAALLHLKCGALSEAERCAREAREAGDPARGALYRIGCERARRGELDAALQCFELLNAEPSVDALHVQALLESCRIEFRRRRFERAYALAETLAHAAPLLEEPCALGALSAHELGDRDRARELAHALMELRAQRPWHAVA